MFDSLVCWWRPQLTLQLFFFRNTNKIFSILRILSVLRRIIAWLRDVVCNYLLARQHSPTEYSGYNRKIYECNFSIIITYIANDKWQITIWIFHFSFYILFDFFGKVNESTHCCNVPMHNDTHTTFQQNQQKKILLQREWEREGEGWNWGKTFLGKRLIQLNVFKRQETIK